MGDLPTKGTSDKLLVKFTSYGPNKEPCGTPEGMTDQVELYPSITTLCSLSVK